MLVETKTVVAQSVDFLPGIEVLGVGAHRDIRLEVPGGQWIGQFVADLQVVQMFAVGEQVKDKDLHREMYCVVECVGMVRGWFEGQCHLLPVAVTRTPGNGRTREDLPVF